MKTLCRTQLDLICLLDYGGLTFAATHT